MADFKQIAEIAAKPKPGDIVRSTTGRSIEIYAVSCGDVFSRSDMLQLHRQTISSWRQSIMREWKSGRIAGVEREVK